MRIKKNILIHVVLLVGILGLIKVIFFSNFFQQFMPCEKQEPIFRTNGEYIERQSGEDWLPFEIKGVNMGTGYPGLFPNETGISSETYLRWLTQIGEMNANTVRVYKIQPPEFYKAFYQYNQEHEKKIYLIQGIDFSDKLMYSEENIFEEKKKQQLFQSTRDVIDAIHGKKLILDTEEESLYCYIHDVSEYVLGYMLGVEWDEMFIEYTCRMNHTMDDFKGNFLKCEEAANPFEIFMAMWADDLLTYEEALWGTQRLITYGNWPNTDALVNEFEINNHTHTYQIQDTEAVFNMERIRELDSLRSGMFASYNVYPYFPYFLQCGDYTTYMDQKGRRNPYQKYLKELTAHHSYPVVISEYGVSTSRDCAYRDIWRDFDHGGVSEREQGKAISEMYQDTKEAGCAGSILFTWQDEWYKTTWNEKILSNPDGRAFWSNAQCAEEFFGLLAFEPGKEGTTCYPDGDVSEWSKKQKIYENDSLQLSVHSDEKYMYFYVDGIENLQKTGRELYLALDVTPKSGIEAHKGHIYSRPVDFKIRFDTRGDGVLMVHNYYNVLPFSAIASYHETSRNMMTRLNQEIQSLCDVSRVDDFSVVKRAEGSIEGTLNNRWFVNEVGILKRGNANPNHPLYISNADYYLEKGKLELRIPWQLLNFYDPSQCMIIDDFHKNNDQIQGLKIDEIYASVYYGDQKNVCEFGAYPLKSWHEPTFHERLKESYHIVKKLFEEERINDN